MKLILLDGDFTFFPPFKNEFSIHLDNDWQKGSGHASTGMWHFSSQTWISAKTTAGFVTTGEETPGRPVFTSSFTTSHSAPPNPTSSRAPPLDWDNARIVELQPRDDGKNENGLIWKDEIKFCYSRGSSRSSRDRRRHWKTKGLECSVKRVARRHERSSKKICLVIFSNISQHNSI